jgi:shikimate kinase
MWRKGTLVSTGTRLGRVHQFLGERSIVLIGLMGAGKTSVGRRLAARLRRQFADSDQMIEAAANRSVQDIFDFYGEQAFRDCEERVIARILQTPAQVVALGGGAWKSEETRTKVAAKAISIWLDPDLSVLIERVQRRNSRPLLQNCDAAHVLKKLDLERRPLYAQADIHVRVRPGPHEHVVDDLMELLWKVSRQPQPHEHAQAGAARPNGTFFQGHEAKPGGQ